MGYGPEDNKTKEICKKVLEEDRRSVKDKIQRMCKKPNEDNCYMLECVPDQYNTQEIPEKSSWKKACVIGICSY